MSIPRSSIARVALVTPLFALAFACGSAPSDGSSTSSSEAVTASSSFPIGSLCYQGTQNSQSTVWYPGDGTIAVNLEWFVLTSWTDASGNLWYAYAGVNFPANTVDGIAWVEASNVTSFETFNSLCGLVSNSGDNHPTGTNPSGNEPRCVQRRASAPAGAPGVCMTVGQLDTILEDIATKFHVVCSPTIEQSNVPKCPITITR